jgi:hypothetical protein
MIQTSTNFNHKSRSKYKNTFGKRKSAKVFLWVNFAKKKGQNSSTFISPVPRTKQVYNVQNQQHSQVHEDVTQV